MKATLPNGTVIEGSPQEVAEALKAIALAPLQAQPLPFLPAEPSQTAPLSPGWMQPFLKPSGCCCPTPDPLNPNGPMFWGGHCPVHSVRFSSVPVSQTATGPFALRVDIPGACELLQ